MKGWKKITTRQFHPEISDMEIGEEEPLIIVIPEDEPMFLPESVPTEPVKEPEKVPARTSQERRPNYEGKKYIGYRGAFLSKKSGSWKLHSPFQNLIWERGPVTAVCGAGKDHPSPSEGCRCGLYAKFQEPFVHDYMQGKNHWFIQVAGWGRMIKGRDRTEGHYDGFKSQHMQILGIRPPHCDRCDNPAEHLVGWTANSEGRLPVCNEHLPSNPDIHKESVADIAKELSNFYGGAAIVPWGQDFEPDGGIGGIVHGEESEKKVAQVLDDVDPGLDPTNEFVEWKPRVDVHGERARKKNQMQQVNDEADKLKGNLNSLMQFAGSSNPDDWNGWTDISKVAAGSFVKELGKVRRYAIDNGWSVKRTTKHEMWYHPDGVQKILVSSTPSDHRAFKNILGDLKNAGLIWPPERARQRKQVEEPETVEEHLESKHDVSIEGLESSEVRELHDMAHEEQCDHSHDKDLLVTSATQRTPTWWRRQRDSILEQIGEDKATVIHKLPNGWTIRQLQTAGDALYEGLLMRHCLKDFAPQMGPMQGSEEGDWTVPMIMPPPRTRNFSLRNHDNIPQATWWEPEGAPQGVELREVAGRANWRPKPHIQQMLRQYHLWGLDQSGMDLARTEWGGTPDNPENTEWEVFPKAHLEKDRGIIVDLPKRPVMEQQPVAQDV